MSVQPRAPGQRPESPCKVLGALLALLAMGVVLGVLISIPHPVTVLVARVLQ